MKLKSPIAKIKGLPIITTLGWGDPMFRDAYIRAGWALRRHNGEDYVSSTNPKDNFGLPILAAHDGFVQRVIWDTEMNTKGNGIYLESDAFEHEGKTKKIITTYWHLAKVFVRAGDRVEAGQKVGTLGNSGMIGNATWNANITNEDIKNPFAYSHIHFGVYVYVLENGQWIVAPDYCEENAGGTVNPSNWFEADWKNKAPVVEFLDDNEDMLAVIWAANIAIAKAKDIIKRVSDFLKNKGR